MPGMPVQAKPVAMQSGTTPAVTPSKAPANAPARPGTETAALN